MPQATFGGVSTELAMANSINFGVSGGVTLVMHVNHVWCHRFRQVCDEDHNADTSQTV